MRLPKLTKLVTNMIKKENKTTEENRVLREAAKILVSQRNSLGEVIHFQGSQDDTLQDSWQETLCYCLGEIRAWLECVPVAVSIRQTEHCTTEHRTTNVIKKREIAKMAASDATNAMQANAKAKAVLVTRYRDEFKIILGDEREKRGLPRDVGLGQDGAVEEEDRGSGGEAGGDEEGAGRQRLKEGN